MHLRTLRKHARAILIDLPLVLSTTILDDIIGDLQIQLENAMISSLGVNNALKVCCGAWS
jgi:hypothetical protein